MSDRNYLTVSADDVWGNFSWALPPDCRCGQLRKAVEDGLIFVSDTVLEKGEGQTNQFYILPVQGDGFFALNEGVAISCCPWCGDAISGRKAAR
jgi:hypothetical protein